MKRMKMLAATMTAAALLVGACSGGGGGGSDAATGGDTSREDPNLTVWLMRGDVPDASQEWLVSEWASRHEGAQLNIEIQDWDGIGTKLQTSLASESQTPDVMELGNDQVVTYASVGALTDLSDLVDKVGGDDLIPALIESGSWDGQLYGMPLFAGSRIFFYNKDTFAKAGVEVPKTLADITTVATKLYEANPDGVDNFQGIWLPAIDVGSAIGWVFTHDNHLAVNEDGKWRGTFSEPSGIAALEELQALWAGAMPIAATVSTDEAWQPAVAYNEGRTAMFSSLVYDFDKISPELQDSTGFFSLPGLKEGTPGHPFAGGSSIGVSAKSQNQAYSRELVEMMMQKDFLEPFAADAGWVPGNIEYASPLETTEYGKVAVIAVENAQPNPATPKWSSLESAHVLREMFLTLALGEDAETVAKTIDEEIDRRLN